jgi:hypothetical protein
MYLLAIRNDDGQLHYWTGGIMWSVHPEEAARFVQEADAEATIDVLRRGDPQVRENVHVVPMPEN